MHLRSTIPRDPTLRTNWSCRFLATYDQNRLWRAPLVVGPSSCRRRCELQGGIEAFLTGHRLDGSQPASRQSVARPPQAPARRREPLVIALTRQVVQEVACCLSCRLGGGHETAARRGSFASRLVPRLSCSASPVSGILSFRGLSDLVGFVSALSRLVAFHLFASSAHFIEFLI